MTHEKYLKKIKYNKLLIIFTQLFILFNFIFLWQILSDKNIINSYIMSSPKKIIITIIKLYKENNLLNHIFVTLKETLIAFFITTILSLIISIILYSSDFIAKVMDPYLTVLNSLPKVALGPIIIITIGANIKGIITMGILISIIISIQNIYNGFKNTDALKIKLLKTFNASKIDIFKYVVIPYNKSVIINTLKINISMCLIGVIMGEFLSSKAGIGYLILYGSQIFNLDLVLSGIVILLFLSIILYEIIEFINKKY